jgi:hypothetical protein
MGSAGSFDESWAERVVPEQQHTNDVGRRWLTGQDVKSSFRQACGGNQARHACFRRHSLLCAAQNALNRTSILIFEKHGQGQSTAVAAPAIEHPHLPGSVMANRLFQACRGGWRIGWHEPERAQLSLKRGEVRGAPESLQFRGWKQMRTKPPRACIDVA